MSSHEDAVQLKTALLMTALEPNYVGYSREVILRASVRTIAAMLAPAKPETQEATIEAIPDTLRALIKEILRLKAEAGL